jgi:hypothetical protein
MDAITDSKVSSSNFCKPHHFRSDNCSHSLQSMYPAKALVLQKHTEDGPGDM